MIDREPDEKWNLFWLAHAKHADGDLDGAMELYEKSKLSGVSNEFTDFYIGDILDRQGKHEAAFQYYIQSATGITEGGAGERSMVPSTTSANWSCFRIDWLSKSRGFSVDGKVSKSFIVENSSLPFPWLASLGVKIPQRNSADKGKMQSIIGEIKVMLKIVPKKYRSIVEKILTSVETNGIYDESEVGKSIYLDIYGATPFFPYSQGMRPMP